MKRIGRNICLLGMLFVLACSDGRTEVPKEVKKISVEVIQIHKQPREELLKLLGTVEANREMKVAFKIGGKIKSLAFEEGQLIEEDSLLGELDTIELMAKKEKAFENRNKAKRDLDRMEKLFNKKITPLASFQDAGSLYISAEAELKIVQDSLENSSIKAPFTGRIIKKLSEVGEVVSPGSPIAILAEIDPILVKASVPDNFIRKVKAGQTACVRVDSYPQKIFKGTINRLETTADPLSRTFRMEVRISNTGEKLRPGLIARVEVIHRKKGDGIFIPLDAIVEFGSSPTVYVVKDLMAEKRIIKTGDIMGENVEALEGLIPGEEVVISGQTYLKDKQPVLIDRGVEKN